MEITKKIKGNDIFKKYLKSIEMLSKEERQGHIEKTFPSLEKSFEFPIIDDTEVIFVYKGNVASASITGDMTGYRKFEAPMKKIEGTNLYYLIRNYEVDGLFNYMIRINEKDEIQDPLNTNSFDNTFGTMSQLKMPEHRLFPELEVYEDIPHGEIIKVKLPETEYFKEKAHKRKAHVYLPPNYDRNKKYKVIYFKDGTSYIECSEINNILDYMINKKEIEPVIAFFIDAITRRDEDREVEYVFQTKDSYVDYFINEVMPFVEKTFGARSDREGRVLVGASNGANIVTYLAYKRHDLFKYIISQSGNFWYSFVEEKGEPYGILMKNSYCPSKFFLTIGMYDDFFWTNKVFYYNLRENKSLAGLKLDQIPAGHSWGLWRNSIRQGLLWLWDEKDCGIHNKYEEVVLDIDLEWRNQGRNEMLEKKDYYLAIGKIKSVDPKNYLKKAKDVWEEPFMIKKIVPEKDNRISLNLQADGYSCYYLALFYNIAENTQIDIYSIDDNIYKEELGNKYSIKNLSKESCAGRDNIFVNWSVIYIDDEFKNFRTSIIADYFGNSDENYSPF